MAASSPIRAEYLQAVAIALAGALIAASIGLTNHWEMATLSGPAVARLDRWTGEVVICTVNTDKGIAAQDAGLGLPAQCAVSR